MRNVRTGKGAFLLLAGNRVEITSLKSNPKTEWAKSTDSSNYVPSTDILFGSQVPGEHNLECDVEGNFDLSSTSANVIQLIQNGGLYPAVLNSTASQNFATGNFNVQNGTCTLTVPGSTMYSFSAHMVSNGPYTLGGG